MSRHPRSPHPDAVRPRETRWLIRVHTHVTQGTPRMLQPFTEATSREKEKLDEEKKKDKTQKRTLRKRLSSRT